MTVAAPFSAAALAIDAPRVAADIEGAMRRAVFERLGRRGIVLGLSGGVDSSVVVGLAARALGADRVIGLLMPEADSSPDSLRLGRVAADAFGVRTIVEDISEVLTAAGCYRRRDEALRAVMPEYGPGYRCKLVLPDMIGRSAYSIHGVTVSTPAGEEKHIRLTADAYLGIVAATNFKQRVRKMMEYHYADRFRLAVAGTPNLLEHDQGFFVKNGDGSADLKPIAHLYKSQVYQIAAYLGVPDEIRRRLPTTDTYPLEQSQEEFYFGLSLEKTDLCLWAMAHSVAIEETAAAVGLTVEQVQRAWDMLASKRQATRYLHEPAALFGSPEDEPGRDYPRTVPATTRGRPAPSAIATTG